MTLRILSFTFFIATYLLLAFAGTFRVGQTIGLPLLALFCVALVKGRNEITPKFLRAGLPWILLVFIGAEGTLLYRIANADPTIVPVQQDNQSVDGSADSLKQALKKNTADIKSRYQLARQLEKSGKTSEAITEYERILNINDKEPDVHFAYGALLLKLGDDSKAEIHLRQAMELYPQDSPWRKNVQQALDQIKSKGIR